MLSMTAGTQQGKELHGAWIWSGMRFPSIQLGSFTFRALHYHAAFEESCVKDLEGATRAGLLVLCVMIMT